MIDAILIEDQSHALQELKVKVMDKFPQINFRSRINSSEFAHTKFIEPLPCIAFIEIGTLCSELTSIVHFFSRQNVEMILISNDKDYVFKIINMGITGYILKPIEECELEKAMQTAMSRISHKQKFKQGESQFDEILKRFSDKDLIGIPTVSGFEFLYVGDIIRCEGLQRCTRIVTLTKSNIVSAYNLGEFKKILLPYNFFAPHKSHLINLQMIRSYLREGTIIMADQSKVPVARRKRTEFLGLIKHP